MRQRHQLALLLEDFHSALDDKVISATQGLLALGQYGSPSGTYLLAGGKAALRLGRFAEAIVLLYQGVKVAEPNTKLWASLQVNRASACAHHGFFRDAISVGEQFLEAVNSLPPETAALIPFAHHAVGFGYDGLKEHKKAATHFRLAMDLHVDPTERARASVDLAFALALDGRPDEADHVLQNIEPVENAFVHFVLAGVTGTVRYHQGRFGEAVLAGERAQALAEGNEDLWAAPLAEFDYWLSRAVYQVGDRHRAGRLALRVAIYATAQRRRELRERADAWLTEIMDKGGIQ